MTRRKTHPQDLRATGALRVIGGRLRGRLIQHLGDPRTRPMKQRVREAVFNLLGNRVVGTHVVDLFAGTGALTWEALSRGAVSATLVERHFPTARMMRQNAMALDVLEQIEVVAGDTFFWARELDPPAIAPREDRPWLVFCSPPYELYVSKLEAMLELVQHMLEVAPSQSLMVVESDRRFNLDELPGKVTWDRREYPPAVLALAQTSARETRRA